MKRNRFYFLLLFSILQCCSDDTDDPAEKKLTLELISNEVSLPYVTVEDFKVVSYTLSDTKDYYDVSYSFKIHNNTEEILDLSECHIQAYIVKDSHEYGAAGSLLADISIPVGGSQLIEYDFNSSTVPDGLAIDGAHVQILFYVPSKINITLEYLIHLK